MRAINHALSGVVIGLAVGQPVLAGALSCASHFVLDAVPHHDDKDRFPLGSKPFTSLLVVDAFLCVLLVIVLTFALTPSAALVPAFCAFLATSPDLMWIPQYMTAKKTGVDPGVSPGFWTQLHAYVQWFTWPKGAWIELGFFAAMLFTVVTML